MRLLYWTEYFFPYINGIIVNASHLLPALRMRGYDIAVITSRGSRDLPAVDEYDGIPVYRFPFQQALSEGKLDAIVQTQRQINTRVCDFKPDIIHLAFAGYSPFFALKSAEISRIPLIVSVHSMVKQTLMEPDTIVRRIFERAAWMASDSYGALQQVLKCLPEIATRSSVIYITCPWPSLAPTPLPFDPPRLLCVGRLVSRKGFHYALDALSALLPRFPNISMVIAGEGPALTELKAQAKAISIEDHVTFTGLIEPQKIFELMNTATVVLTPSREEGLCIVAVQAAMMGRSVIGSRVPGLTEVIVPDETGLLVEPESSNALAGAIAFLLDHPQAAIQMGIAARQRAAELFNWQKFLNAYDTVYRKFGK